MLEIIVQNRKEAIMAEKFGADRVELVSAMREGGLTPSYGAIKQVLNSVSIPVQVMIRPHSYYYNYGKSDMEIITDDIKKVLELGGNRIVFGTLTEGKKVNEKNLEKIINISSELDITFHRAFEDILFQHEAYKTLSKYKKNVKRILTSAGAVGCVEGKYKLRELVKLSQKIGGPIIMPGAEDLGAETINRVHETVDAQQYHVGPTVRINESYANDFDKKKIDYIINVLKNDII